MLKQKPLSYYQSSLFAKKLKKRSTSTSTNKQNLSVTHNNSIVLQPNSNINSKSHLNSKLSKNPNVNKQKSKKPKKSQSRQRSTSKLPLTNNLVFQQNKQMALKQKQTETQPKKIKKSRNNSSSIIYCENEYKAYTKSFINQSSQFIEKKNKQMKYANPLNNFLPQMSKSSTVVSSSTGNIQFSQWSRQDHYEKNYDLLSVNNLMGVDNQAKTANGFKREDYTVKSARQGLNANNKYKLTPARAATIIQKTWRGYLTRKLLQEYIDSFQPIYEQQLKDIRSGRQSRNEARSVISSNRNHHQKSSFFDKSQLQECSQIQPIQSHVSQSLGTTNKLHNQTSSLLFTDHNNDEQSYQCENQLIQPEKNLYVKVKGNEQYCDIPVQFFKKPVVLTSTIKRDQSNLISEKSNEEFSCSSRRKNAMKVTPETGSRVSEFTIKHGGNTTQNTSRKSQVPIQQTLKHPTTRMIPSLSICPKTINFSISSKPQKYSPIKQLQVHCHSLSTLFHQFNSSCISQLKTQIKMNRMTVNELMQRKDALRDIVDNGMEFVKNVQEQITKALKEMDRIVKEGCDSSSERENRENTSMSQIDSSTQRQEVPRSINPKYAKQAKLKQSPSQNISNQKYIADLQSPPFPYESQINSSSSQKPNKKNIKQNTKGCTSQFYTIELPTEQYSAKGKSPIQEDYEDEESYREEDYQPDEQPQSQDYTSRTLRMNPLYASHQQSLQILNQFLLNLIEQYQQTLQTKSVSQLQYLCETLKRVSCDSQNKTIIDRCLIEFIVEIMSETWTLKQIYQGFRQIVQQGCDDSSQDPSNDQGQQSDRSEMDWKLLGTVRKWIEELYKWEMNIIQEVPSKMQSSSFLHTENISLINTENVSLNDLREAVSNLSNPANFQLDLSSHYK